MAQRATAVACSNIAFCKYWGNTNHALRLPVSGSISMNLGGLYTRTTVHFNPELRVDCANVDGKEMLGGGLERISKHLDFARQLAGITTRAEVLSENNFPTGAGIASSASAFAALSVASAAALNLSLTERELSATHGLALDQPRGVYRAASWNGISARIMLLVMPKALHPQIIGR